MILSRTHNDIHEFFICTPTLLALTPYGIALLYQLDSHEGHYILFFLFTSRARNLLCTSASFCGQLHPTSAVQPVHTTRAHQSESTAQRYRCGGGQPDSGTCPSRTHVPVTSQRVLPGVALSFAEPGEEGDKHSEAIGSRERLGESWKVLSDIYIYYEDTLKREGNCPNLSIKIYRGSQLIDVGVLVCISVP